MDANVPRHTPSADLASERVQRAAKLNFRTLYRDYRSKVYGTVHHVVGLTDEVDDIVQNVFMEIHRSLPRYKGNSQLSTWIYRIAVNVSLQYIRKRKRRRVFLFFKDDQRQFDGDSYEEKGRYESRDVLEKLYAELDKLNEKKRLVFTLHELDGMDLDQIAEICDIPVNTVRSRLHSARTELTQRMKRAGMLEKTP